MTKPTIYGDSISGNCYKLQLAAAQASFDHRWQEINLLKGETRTPDFLDMNPNGKVPVLDLGDGRCLPESNAILSYIADGTALLGGDRYERANVLAWMCFEQYSHEPFIATARFIVKYLGNPPEQQQSLESKKPGGYRALDVMERHLQSHPYFANDAYSIADIALFAYTHVAHEGGFDLSTYAGINTWIDRVRGTDGYVPMKA